jgi:hypothetical protein
MGEWNIENQQGKVWTSYSIDKEYRDIYLFSPTYGDITTNLQKRKMWIDTYRIRWCVTFVRASHGFRENWVEMAAKGAFTAMDDRKDFAVIYGYRPVDSSRSSACTSSIPTQITCLTCSGSRCFEHL